ncbi:MAG: aminoacyl-tRNA hydrolase [Gammaproteobacteria bacterium]|nr:aminoacyl-tRNA hydrolase [Gammaproteobacteria bacterium]
MTPRSASNSTIPIDEVEIKFVRAQGAGGQNVNKVSSAAHLRFDIKASSLAEGCKEKLLALSDSRISAEGVVVIKAQRFRSQGMNREDALARLDEIFKKALVRQKKRKATRPSRAAKQRRLEHKSKQGKQKVLRRKVEY